MGSTLFLVGVEAAVYRDGRYLVIRRSHRDTDFPGRLALPGGTVELESDGEGILEATARREVREEAGVEVEEAAHFLQSKNFSLGAERHVVDVVFLCRYRTGHARPDGVESEAVYWVSPAELAQRDDAPDWLRRSIALAEAKRVELGWR